MITAITAKPGQGMTYRCLCQDCGHVQTYPTETAQIEAHDEQTFCEKCVKGVMCCCSGCMEWAKYHAPEDSQ